MTDAVAATRAEDVASLGDQLAVGRHPWPVLRLRLDMEPEEFESVRSEFVQALAKAIGVTASEIAIVDIRRGCTNLAIQVPPAVAHISEGVGPTLPPAVRQLADPFRLQRLEPDHGINSTFSLRVRSPKPRERVLSWLHLSDIHFPDDATSVLASPPELFLEDLPGCLDEDDLKPSFVLVSGDISYSAATQQFDYAREFLLSLEEVLPYPRTPILTVPGNHDASWDPIEEDVSLEEELRAAVQRAPDIISRVLAGELASSLGTHLLRRFANYTDFVSRLPDSFSHPRPREGCYYVTKLSIEGLTVGIAGFNSALLTTTGRLVANIVDSLVGADTTERKALAAELKNRLRKEIRGNDLGHLSLGDYQLKVAREELKNSDIRIALLHHPPESDWFSWEDQEVQRAYLSEYDFIHRGHRHEPLMNYRGVGFHGPSFEVGAGALAGDLGPKEEGFTAVRLDGSERATFFFWAPGGRIRRWRRDRDTAKPNGWIQHELPQRLVDRIARRAT